MTKQRLTRDDLLLATPKPVHNSINKEAYRRQPQRTVINKKRHHVMIISGSTELSEMLQAVLFQEGYRVSIIHDGLRGLLAVKRYEPDLILVDWAPPRITGLELCDRLSDSEKPIVLLTQNDNVAQRVQGFESGAIDCISPPFAKEEFVSRINARLARLSLAQNIKDVLCCADLLLNRKTREVFHSGSFIKLTAKEFDLLEYLMTNYFIVVTRSQILEHVWGYDYAGASNIIEVYIRYLRTKLKKTAGASLIRTVRGVGYILRDA